MPAGSQADPQPTASAAVSTAATPASAISFGIGTGTGRASGLATVQSSMRMGHMDMGSMAMGDSVMLGSVAMGGGSGGGATQHLPGLEAVVARAGALSHAQQHGGGAMPHGHAHGGGQCPSMLTLDFNPMDEPSWMGGRVPVRIWMHACVGVYVPACMYA